MKTICFYHKNCFDGICSAWVFWKRFGGAFDKNGIALEESLVELNAINYGDSFPFHEYGKNDSIYIVDFSLKRDELISLKEQVNSLLVLDHHKTAQANCEGLDFCIFDMSESGASLAWKYFFPNQKLPLLVRYIKDRDLWLFKEEYSQEVNAWIQSFPMSIRIYEELFQWTGFDALSGSLAKPIEGGASILRYKNQMIENICKNAAFDKNGIPTVNTSILFSEVGHELCKMFPHKPYAQYYFDRLGDNTRQWGVRSIGDFDVSEVAKSHGGGGHKNAAGWQHSLSEL